MSQIRNFTVEKFIKTKSGIVVNNNLFKDKHHGDHTHDFIEIAYMLDGETRQYVDGVEYNLRHGQMLFIVPGQVHDFYVKKGTRIIDVLIDPAWLGISLIKPENAFSILSLSSFSAFENSVDKMMVCLTFNRQERAVIESILNMMANEQKNMLANYDHAQRLLTELLLTHIFRKMSGSSNEFVISPEFLQFIRQNCDKKLTLSELSRMCFYNPSYFSRMFREHYGMTLTEFVQNSRFERACELILKDELTTDEVVSLSGFGSKRTMYKVFYEKIGMTPAQYKQKNRR